LISKWNDLAIGIFVKLTQGVCHVISPSSVVEQLRKISISGDMRFIKLLSASMIDDISIVVDKISSTAYSLASFVNKISITILLYNWISILIEIKVTSDFMRMEVMLLNIEWGRYFTLFIKFFLLEHLLLIEVVDYITIWINKIASFVGLSSVFVEILSIFIRFTY